MASDLGLNCLLMPVCPNTWIKYVNLIKSTPSVLWNPQLNNPGSARVLPGSRMDCSKFWDNYGNELISPNIKNKNGEY